MLSLPCRSISFVAAIVIALAVSAVLPNTTRADETIVVGQQAQVLADDHVIESMRGLVRRINLLAKQPSNPVLKPEQPWELRVAAAASSGIKGNSTRRAKTTPRYIVSSCRC